MLLAGAGVSSSSSQGGAFPFNVDVLLSRSDWSVGSAFIYIMLLAGAGADTSPARGGALAFTVDNTPSYALWNNGSALH